MKIEKSTINGIMAIITIIVLMLAIAVPMYAKQKSVENTISVQGNYGIGETIGLYSGTENITELFDGYTDFPIDTYLGWESNNDTIFYGIKETGANKNAVYYGDFTTYTGSGSHTTVMNWSSVPETTYNSIRYIVIPLNYTNEMMADFDFVRITSNIDTDNGTFFALVYEADATTLFTTVPINIDNDTVLITIDYDIKTTMNAYPNGTVYLMFIGADGFFNQAQSSFTWKIDGNSLDPSDYAFGSEFTDFTMWVLMVSIFDVVFFMAIIFASPWIDLKLDQRKTMPKIKNK